MEKDIDKLYHQYGKKNGLFSKFRFKRKINNEKFDKIVDDLYNIINKINSNQFDIKKEDLYGVIIRLLDENSYEDIEKIIKDYNDSKNIHMEKIEEILTKTLFELAGVKDERLLKGIQLDVAAYLCANDIDYSKILSIYGETVFNAILENDSYSTYSKNYNSYTLKDEQLESYHDLFNHDFDNNDNIRDVLYAFNDLMSQIMSKYSKDELFNNSELIKKEITKGLTYLLPKKSKRENNLFSNNRELLDKIIDDFDTKSIIVVYQSKEYLKPIMDLIKSSVLTTEEKESLKEMYNLFSRLSDAIKSKDFKVLKNIIDEVKSTNNNEFEFYELLNNYVLDYEYMLRKDIVENARSFENLSTDNYIFSSNEGKELDCECVYIEKSDELKSTLIHLFSNKELKYHEQKESFCRISLNTACTHALQYKTRTKEELKDLIIKIYKLYKKADDNSSLESTKEKLKELLTEEEYELCEQKYNLYVDHYNDRSETDQIFTIGNDLYNFVREETNDFKEPLIPGIDDYKDMNWLLKRYLISPNGESLLATQILRLNSENDFRSLINLNDSFPYVMGVTFDGDSLNEESILISSTSNIESNNRPLHSFDDAYPLERRSATLNMLQNTVGNSYMVHRTNSEIDLIRSGVEAKSLLLFFNEPITNKVLDGVRKARELAKKNNLKLVIVNYQAILEDLQAKDEEKLKLLDNEDKSIDNTTSKSM